MPLEGACHGGNRLLNPPNRSLMSETLWRDFASLILPQNVTFRYSPFVETLRAAEWCRSQISDRSNVAITL